MRAWRLVIGIAAAALVVVLLFRWAVTPREPVAEKPNHADTLAVLRAQWAADSATLRVQIVDAERRADSAVRASRTANAAVGRLRRVADSLRATRLGTHVPVLGTPNYSPLSDTLLALAVAEADTLRVALDSSVRVTRYLTTAYRQSVHANALRESMLIGAQGQLSQERALWADEREAWQATVKKLQRGCRVLGLLPCPTLAAGYGVTLAGGAVHAGPVLSVSIPLRF